MRTAILAILVGLGLCLVVSWSRADESMKSDKIVTGYLVDNACAAGMMKKDNPEAAAADHPKSCCLKEACAASGYCVIDGKTQTKLDAASNDKAKEYLAKADSSTRVTVKGDLNADGTLKVDSIVAAPAK